MAMLQPIRTTTAHMRAGHLTVAPESMPLPQVPIGVDIHTGAAFRYDPFLAYQRSVVNDASILVAGSKGGGKSALVKSLAIRLAAHGYLIRYVDPKGETDPLCELFGVQALRPGEVVINPLDGAADDPDRAGAIAVDVLQAALSRGLSELERHAVQSCIRWMVVERGAPTLGRLATMLADEDRVARMPVEMSPLDVRDLRAALANLAVSDGGRMFLGESTVDVPADQPFVAIDLSGHDEITTRMLMVVVASWLSAMWVQPTHQSVVILDEVWRLVRNVHTALWLQNATKMARKYGASIIPVLQHLTDLATAGDAGSRTRELAEGVLSDSEVRVIYRQPTDQHRHLREKLHLTQPELHQVSLLRPGQAIWKVGQRSTVVQHLLTETEMAVIDTDKALGGRR